MRWNGFPRLFFLSVALLAPSSIRAGENDGILESVHADIERLRRDRDMLEARIRMLQSQLEETRLALINAKIQVDLADLRCLQYREELKLVKAEKGIAGGVSGNRSKGESPIQLIPPFVKKPVPVKSVVAQGKITAIGHDGSLLQISIGSDAGIKEGQILDVFRLGSADGKQRILPIYLGTVTLQRVDPQAALGRYQSVPGLERRIKVGDEVASELVVNVK